MKQALILVALISLSGCGALGKVAGAPTFANDVGSKVDEAGMDWLKGRFERHGELTCTMRELGVEAILVTVQNGVALSACKPVAEDAGANDD